MSRSMTVPSKMVAGEGWHKESELDFRRCEGVAPGDESGIDVSGFDGTFKSVRCEVGVKNPDWTCCVGRVDSFSLIFFNTVRRHMEANQTF